MNNLATQSESRVLKPLARGDGPVTWLRDEIDGLFEDFSTAWRGRRLTMPEGLMSGEIRPVVELIEQDGGYSLTVDVPGINAKDIDVELADRILTVSGERHSEGETHDGGYLISERSYGSFRRVIALPDDIDPASVNANIRDGVLKIEMKTDVNAPTKRRKIEIGK